MGLRRLRGTAPGRYSQRTAGLESLSRRMSARGIARPGFRTRRPADCKAPDDGGEYCGFHAWELRTGLGVRWIGIPLTQAQHFLLGTASVSVLGYGHNLAEEPAIVLWNAVSN